MASNSMLRAIPTGGLLDGFGNLAAKENAYWWKTRTWLVQVLIWAALVNGILAIILWVEPRSGGGAGSSGRGLVEHGVEVFLVMASLAMGVGTVIIGQDAIIDEKRSGTAAWILSKPIARSAFILAKFFAHALGILVTMVLIQGALAYAQTAAATGVKPSPLGWLAALGLLFLFLLFFLALTLMLGTFFDGRGAVIGIPLVVLFGYQLIAGIIPQLGDVLPYVLTISLGPDRPALAQQLMAGRPLGNPLPLVATVAWTVLFMAVAVRRFQREEF